MNIPNFDNIQFVDKNGFLTDQWKQILTQLFTSLQQNAGNEGLVMPSQTASNIALIQNNLVNGLPTCQFGTMIYDTTNNQPKIAVSNAGLPLFKTIQTI